MMITLKQFVLIAVLGAAIGLIVNTVSPNRIDLVGKYRTLSSGEGPIVPPSAQAGDPPFIDINQAQMEFSLGQAIWVDARSPEEFICGTIPGSINIPFDYLPEGDLRAYFDSAMGNPARDREVIVFCSGEECDLSMMLARNLKTYGFTNLLIFFGGAREWEKFGLELERRGKCGE